MNNYFQNNNLRVLLIGSNGQLGNDFRKLFDKKNIEYTATDYKELNIVNSTDLEEFFKENGNFTHIINCAAYLEIIKGASSFTLKHCSVSFSALSTSLYAAQFIIWKKKESLFGRRYYFPIICLREIKK